MDLAEVISSKFSEENFKNILSKATNNVNVSLTGWKFEAGSAKGDNYLSVVHRVQIDGLADGKKIQTKVIIKTLPRNVATRKTFRSAEFFENEINFYSKVTFFKIILSTNIIYENFGGLLGYSFDERISGV